MSIVIGNAESSNRTKSVFSQNWSQPRGALSEFQRGGGGSKKTSIPHSRVDSENFGRGDKILN